MTLKDSTSVTYDQMSSALGSLLLLWARLEEAVRMEIALLSNANPNAGHSFATAMQTWEKIVVGSQPSAQLLDQLAQSIHNQIKEKRAIRNGICHGLQGIAGEHGDGQASVSWCLNGVEGSITWTELQQCCQWLSKVPSAISFISKSAHQPDNLRMADNAENRAWWLAEFSISLPT